MELSILSEILYIGLCYEKGRVYTNYWKPWYRKLLLKQINIWKVIVERIYNNNFDGISEILENLEKLAQKYNLTHYYIYINEDLNNKKSKTIEVILSNEQKKVTMLMIEILKRLENLNDKFYVKKKALNFLNALHNLPRALFIEELNSDPIFKKISVTDAIKYASIHLPNEIIEKYKI